MKSEPYSQFKHGDLILRDYLAADRTVLANERTLLSYVRTAMAFAAAGAALIHFFDYMPVQVVGWIIIPAAVSILAIGINRYLRMRQRLAKLVDSAGPEKQ